MSSDLAISVGMFGKLLFSGRRKKYTVSLTQVQEQSWGGGEGKERGKGRRERGREGEISKLGTTSREDQEL